MTSTVDGLSTITVAQSLASAATRGGALTVIDDAGSATRSWLEVHEQASRMASVLAEYGVGPGHRLGVLADTGFDTVAAIQAIWWAGASVTVLPPAAGDVAGHTEYLTTVGRLCEFTLVIAEDPAVAGAAGRVLALADLVERAAVAQPAAAAQPSPDELAVLQFTSGSTATPRGVPVSHANLAANLAGIHQATDHERYHDEQPLVSWLPLHHDMGLIGYLALPMLCGCSLVTMSPAVFARRPTRWLQALADYRGFSSAAPNFAFGLATRLLVTQPELDLSGVRVLVCGGEPIDPEVIGRFCTAAAARGLDPAAVIPAYGLAESTLAVSFGAGPAGPRFDVVDADQFAATGTAVPAPSGRALTILGPPLPSTEVQILGPQGQQLGRRQVGRVQLRGPSVVSGYWGQQPWDGWLPTGDLGYLTEAGELVVCGRADDVIFAAGRNVYPQDIEAAACRVPGVRGGGAVAFAVASERGGQQPAVVVESSASSQRAEPELIEAVTVAVIDSTGLAPAWVRVVAGGQIPRTTSGKLRRSRSRELFDRQPPAGGAR